MASGKDALVTLMLDQRELDHDGGYRAGVADLHLHFSFAVGRRSHGEKARLKIRLRELV